MIPKPSDVPFPQPFESDDGLGMEIEDDNIFDNDVEDEGALDIERIDVGVWERIPLPEDRSGKARLFLTYVVSGVWSSYILVALSSYLVTKDSLLLTPLIIVTAPFWSVISYYFPRHQRRA